MCNQNFSNESRGIKNQESEMSIVKSGKRNERECEAIFRKGNGGPSEYHQVATYVNWHFGPLNRNNTH